MGIFTYIKIGGAIAVFLVAGYFVLNYKHLQATNLKLKAEVVSLKRVAEIYERDATTDKEIASEKERVDQLTPEQLDSEYNRLRDYGSGEGPNSTPPKD